MNLVSGSKELFENALLDVRKSVYEYLKAPEYGRRFLPRDVYEAVYSYIDAGGKSLRPAVLLFSCGAVGGNAMTALPAAAAVEVYHTWTLVHDDIIDRDDKRRGNPTVHEQFRRKAAQEYHYEEKEAQHYGLSVAILAGDLQQGWATQLLCELHPKHGLNPTVALYLISDLKMNVQGTLIEGEMLDIWYTKQDIESLSESLIVEMLWKKTGALYEFAGRAGAMIGLETSNSDHPMVKALSTFTSKCGTAFQLQDDILGVVGDEERLGKPVGSDIREGKRTTIVYYALKNASEAQRAKLLDVLGNERAAEEDIRQTISLLRDLGGIERTGNLARSYVNEAMTYLDHVPASKYKSLLSTWAEYMIEREF
ncbi:MAG: polyprenyl synthetase family protein [Chloroflexi bacterium]|nr:polyprenyl synthetase family protein [Chloroflexota bacterium]